MGITAIVSGGSSTELSLLSSVGMGLGSLFAAVALVFLLGYLDLFTAASWRDRQQQKALVAGIIPLLVVFVGIVLFQAMLVLSGAS